MRKLNFGIVGAGWPGQQHAIAIRKIESANLYACADLDKTRRIEFEKEYRPKKIYVDYQELLQDRQIDAVIVCLPNFLHFPASLAGLETGKHILCEKPPTLNAGEMKVLRDEASKRNRTYFFSRQSRFSPAMRAAKAAVERGDLGKIYHATATFIRSRGIPDMIADWFTDKKLSGGGALIDIGVHALDSVWYLMGTPRPVSVSAQVFRNFEHLAKSEVFDVEDAAYAFIRFENGAVAQLETAWAGNLTDVAPPRKFFGQELINSVVYGTKATVRLNPPTLFQDRNGELATVPLNAKDDEPNGFELQLRNFIGVLRGETEPINNADQAVALMEMIDAIYASSAAGREVPIVDLKKMQP
jgi:predicted dehydrogenase